MPHNHEEEPISAATYHEEPLDGFEEPKQSRVPPEGGFKRRDSNRGMFVFTVEEEGDKSTKVFQVFIQRIKFGRNTFIMTTLRDMSHWLEVERHKNKLRTQSWAQTAHEFRNPLNSIIQSL